MIILALWTEVSYLTFLGLQFPLLQNGADTSQGGCDGGDNVGKLRNVWLAA